MRILAVDTSSERGSVCVVDGEEILGEIRVASSIQYSERLFRSVEFLFGFLPFSVSDIDLFVAARGPGSFTGLRVGLAAMGAFSWAFRKPGAGITTLEALAWKTGIHDASLAAMMDARRGEIYGAVYHRAADDTLVEEQAPVVLKPAEWFASLPSRSLVFCGDGALRYRSVIEAKPEWKLHRMELYLAATIALMATGPHSGPLEPLYVRRTDAEIARESIGNPNP
jgi:tRNA threonylcarbamoyladenosine biosynthesis protein TsaB